jgi:hypothetical protein
LLACWLTRDWVLLFRAAGIKYTEKHIPIS